MQQWSAPLNCGAAACRPVAKLLSDATALSGRVFDTRTDVSVLITIAHSHRAACCYFSTWQRLSRVLSRLRLYRCLSTITAATHPATHSALLSAAPCLPRPLAQLCRWSLAVSATVSLCRDTAKISRRDLITVGSVPASRCQAMQSWLAWWAWHDGGSGCWITVVSVSLTNLLRRLQHGL